LNKEVKLLTFPDRTTMLGGIISNYLKGTTELKDEVIHLLFAANRWEKKYYPSFNIV
jgi:dTMP kinase